MPSSAVDPNLIPVDNPILGMIDAEAARQGVDRNLAHTVAQMESGYNPRAVSDAGAQGVFQLMPGTAKDMGVTDPMNPAQNIRGGIKYLATLGRKYGPDDTVRILAGYNAGPGNVDKYGGVPPFPETANYVEKGTRLLASAAPSSDLSADPNLTPVPAAPSPGDLTPAAAASPAQKSVQILPPLSEPPGGKPAPPEKTFKGFLDNATLGLGRILEPLTDPAGTLENVTNLLQGMSEKSGFAPVMGQPRQQVVDGIVNLYKHRYGSLEGFKNAFYDDPVGIAADVATVFSGAGLGLDAAQDFLKASGLAEHAASIADILPEAKVAGVAGQTRVQAGVQGAVDALGKRYPEIIRAGFEKAPTGVLGGPHGMLGAAKYGAAKKAAEILKEGWQSGTKAFDAPAATTAAEAAAPAAEAMTPGQILAKSQGQDWSTLSANDQAMLEQIAKGQTNVATQPTARPAAAPATAPEVPATVRPAAPAEPLKPGDVVQWQSQGVDQFPQPRAIRGFSPDGKWAFVEGTNTGIPVEQLTRAEAPSAPPAAAAVPPGLTSSDLARSLYGNRPLTDVEAANVQNLYSQVGSGQPPVARSSLGVMPPAEAAQVFPGMGLTPETPAAAPPGSASEPPPVPAAPTRTLAEIQGEISQRLQNLQNLAKQPQTPEVVQQTSAELSALGRLKNERPIPPGAAQAAAPPAAPVAREASAAASEKLDDLEMFRQMREENPTTFGDYSVISSTGSKGTRFWVSKDTGETVGPFATEAEGVIKARELAGVPAKPPAGPLVDPVAFVREQLAAGNRVSEATLQRQFGMKYSAARKLLKDLSPAATPEQGRVAFEAAKASGQPAVTPTPEEAPATSEPPSDLEQQLAASIREAQSRKAAAPEVQPGQTVAEALAAQAPPGPKSLAEMMAGIPERPELEKLDFAHITRTRNVERLYDTMREAGITPEMVDAEGDAGWAAVAKKAKIGPKGKSYVPSETTKAQLRQRFAERKP